METEIEIVKLTWFIVGQLADSRPAVLRGQAQDLQGHMIASLSFSLTFPSG